MVDIGVAHSGGPIAPVPTYRIVVEGTLDPKWSERLGGLSLSSHVGTSGAATTEFVGPLDQAALMGVLQRLFAYGAVVLSLEALAAEKN